MGWFVKHSRFCFLLTDSWWESTKKTKKNTHKPPRHHDKNRKWRLWCVCVRLYLCLNCSTQLRPTFSSPGGLQQEATDRLVQRGKHRPADIEIHSHSPHTPRFLSHLFFVVDFVTNREKKEALNTVLGVWQQRGYYLILSSRWKQQGRPEGPGSLHTRLSLPLPLFPRSHQFSLHHKCYCRARIQLFTPRICSVHQQQLLLFVCLFFSISCAKWIVAVHRREKGPYEFSKNKYRLASKTLHGQVGNLQDSLWTMNPKN